MPVHPIARSGLRSSARARRLPSRIPLGTKYVVESTGAADDLGQVYSRYLVFPDGSTFHLPPARAPRSAIGRPGRRKKSRRH